jgi:hypothetical protein
MIRAGYAHRFDMAPISTRNTSVIGCARSYRTLRDGTFEGHCSRHFVPGYDRVVPPGRGPAGGLGSFKCPNPAEALTKLALMGLKPLAESSSPFGAEIQELRLPAPGLFLQDKTSQIELRVSKTEATYGSTKSRGGAAW